MHRGRWVHACIVAGARAGGHANVTDMTVLIVYSEAGGVSKTTTAVSLATIAARQDIPTLLVDLDPRAAATKWLQAQPNEDWQTIAAIIAEPEPDGWANDLSLPTDWSPNLRILPSDRSLANREREHADHSELRLTASLQDVPESLIVIDCPNRQGGMLTQNALAAADGVIYAATASQDGIDGVEGARASVEKFCRSRERIGAPAKLQELGIVVGSVPDPVITRVARASLSDLSETGLLLEPTVPRRTIVDQARMTGQWYGDFEKGQTVTDAYEQIFSAVKAKISE